ncbi:MAG TPA: TOBE domain-containing protein, partial [Agromyces sp.]|nr:TOBE domain-containing protein [Agromyces sp.]
EKMTVDSAPEAGAGVHAAPGTVVETIYLGSGIRIVVDLDAGPRVSVLEQNDRNRAHDEDRGDRVVVSWHDDDVVALGGADAASAPAA